LIDAGVKPGDCVVLIGDNRLEWMICDFAIQAIGAVTVPIYPNSTPEIAAKIIENSEAVYGIASDERAASKLGLKTVARMDDEVAGWIRSGPTHTAEIARRLAAIKPDDLCTIVYTSGTTGDPKGVELAHRCVADISKSAASVHPIGETDAALSFLPWAHVFGRINDIFVGMVFGGQMWISRGADHLAAELHEVQPTVMCSVPRMYEKMYAAVLVRVRGLSYRRPREHEAVRRARLHHLPDDLRLPRLAVAVLPRRPRLPVGVVLVQPVLARELRLDDGIEDAARRAVDVHHVHVLRPSHDVLPPVAS